MRIHLNVVCCDVMSHQKTKQKMRTVLLPDSLSAFERIHETNKAIALCGVGSEAKTVGVSGAPAPHHAARMTEGMGRELELFCCRLPWSSGSWGPARPWL